MPLDEERSVFMDNEIGVAVMAVSLDRNKQLSIRIDGEVKPSDDLLIKIFQRLHSTAPAFAAMMCQVCRWYAEDTPEGRWVEQSAEMSASKEPEPRSMTDKIAPELEAKAVKNPGVDYLL